MATMVKSKRRYASYGKQVPFDAYDGSAVRRLTGEDVSSRPLVRPKERAAARPRVRVREAGRVSIFAVVGFASVAVFAVLLLMSYVQLASLSNDVVSLRNQMTTLKTEEATLRAQYELAYDLGSIEQGVTANGTMVKPQNGQVFYVDVSSPDTVVLFGEDVPQKGIAGCMQSLQDICADIVEYFK